MIRNIKKCGIALFVIISLLTQTGYAAVIKYEGSKITVSGNDATRQSGMEVTFQIIGPFDDNIPDVEAALKREFGVSGEMENTYFNSFLTGEDGAYSFSVDVAKTNKFYGVAVKEPGGQLVTSSLFVAEQKYINAALAQINACRSAADMKDVFDNPEYENILINNFLIFREIASQSDRMKVYLQVFADKGAGFDSFAAFEDSLIRASSITRTATAKNPAEARAYAQNIDFAPSDFYDGYKVMDEEQKNGVYKRMITQAPADYQDYIRLFDESCFLQKIQSEHYASNLTKLLTDYEKKFDLDLTGYAAVSLEVNKKLIQKEFSDMAEFKAALSKAIKDAGDKGTDKGGAGGSGGNHGTSPGNTGGVANIPNVIPELPSEPAQPFDDIDDVAWAKEMIETLYEKGIVAGKADGKFFPHDPISREEFVKIAVCAFGLENQTAAAAFEDVPQEAWYYQYVAAGVKAGLIKGISDNEFGSGSVITRQDIATVLYRYLQSTGKELPAQGTLFADDDEIAAYARDGVYALKNLGVLSGRGANRFEPASPASRAEVAKIIGMLLEV